MTIIKKKSLTEHEFEELTKRLSDFSARKIEVARLILVEGRPQKEAGETHGMSKQNVNNLIKRIRAILADAPMGWVLVSEYVPPEMKAEIEQRLIALRAQHHNQIK